jgi:hypothetical protein
VQLPRREHHDAGDGGGARIGNPHKHYGWGCASCVQFTYSLLAWQASLVPTTLGPEIRYHGFQALAFECNLFRYTTGAGRCGRRSATVDLFTAL